jgi:hypothetical protein
MDAGAPGRDYTSKGAGSSMPGAGKAGRCGEVSDICSGKVCEPDFSRMGAGNTIREVAALPTSLWRAEPLEPGIRTKTAEARRYR